MKPMNPDLDIEQILSLIAGYKRCKYMLILWDEHRLELLEKYPHITEGIAPDMILYERSSAYLILGIALLYTVLERLHDLKIPLPEPIINDVAEMYPNMCEFRNCVFHIQDEMLSTRQFALMESPDCLARLKKIVLELDSFFDSKPTAFLRSLII